MPSHAEKAGGIRFYGKNAEAALLSAAMPDAVLEEMEYPPSVAGLSFLEQGRLAASSRLFIIVIKKQNAKL